MKILFVSSGNNSSQISPIIKNQADSIIEFDGSIEITFYTIKGKGIKNYFKASQNLKRFLNKNKFDLIHSHYALSGYVTTLSGSKLPKVVSIMGSDAYFGFPYSFITPFLAKKYWNFTIAKSENLVSLLRLKDNYKKIPNGVDTNRYKPIEKSNAREKIHLDQNKIYILFASNPSRAEKNYKLAEEVFRKLNISNSELITIYGQNNEIMPYYYNAVDLLLFTSQREGSPNVIKEAMACNCPIVATDVGDVKEVISDCINCFVGADNKDELINHTKIILRDGNRTNGQHRIFKIGLESKVVAQKIINIYRTLIEKE